MSACISITRAAFLIALGLYLCVPAQCAEMPATSPDKLDLTEISIESLLDVKVTTASKKSESLSQSPAAVFVVDSTDIYRYGYQTLAAALRSIVGLYTSSDREFDYLGVRGYSRSGDYNGRILLLIDGHRVNDPIFDTATIDQDCPVDMQDVERIEVVKGPGSSLWGTNALLATVNIITRTGRDTAGMRLSTNGEKYHAEYGDTFKGDTDIVFSATGMRSDGQKKIYFPEFDSPDTNNGVAENIDGTNATRTRLAVTHEGLRFAYTRGVRSKALPTAPYGTIFNDPGTKTTDGRTHMELSYGSQNNESSKHDFFVRVFSDEYKYIGNYAYYDPPRVISVDDYIAKWWGAEVRLSNELSDRLSVTYGADYQRAGRIVMDNYDIDPYWEYDSYSFTQTTSSLYAQASYKPNELLNLTLGTRRDKFSSFGSTWSPRAALVYSPSDNTSIKLLYGNAFRAPNYYEISWPEDDAPPVQPEKMRTQELVWEQRLNSNSRLIASLFRFEVSDIITMETNDYSYITNKGTATSGGFEVQYETRSSRGTRGYAGLSVTRMTASDDMVTNSPNVLLTAGLSMPILSQRYYISPQIQTTGRVFTYSGERIAPRTAVDLVMTTAEKSKGTNVSLGIYNLLGTTVYTPGPSGRTQDKIPQPERTVRLMVSRKF